MSPGPESAEGESKIVGICATCGRPLTQVGPKGECLRCLVSLGVAAEESGSEQHRSRRTLGRLRYDHFEVEIGADGLPVELGAGAMAVTYRARDTVLNSVVALKVIDRKIAQMPGVRSRFLREARAAAHIHHPNVARVSHYGEQDGECFYVMELVEGETLEAKVRREGPLPLALALEIIEQTARALAAAEKCGVVHRDIKPSNIMLESDPSGIPIVKVIDYGIAKVLVPEAERGAEQTQTGFIGSPAFASPEQFAPSERTKIDTRSDIYSLGVTFWYLLSGRVPFVGRTLGEVAAKQAEELPLEQLKNTHVPSRVVALLRSMLAVDPAKRPQTARELLSAIHRCYTKFSVEARSRRKRSTMVAAGAILVLGAIAFGTWIYERAQSSAAVERSIAVLPFENLSSSADDAYLAAGIQDEILTKLASVGDLKVISRLSAAKYKSRPEDLKTVARELGVCTVLEGSVQKAGDRARVNVQLIDARLDTHLWANSYDRGLKDVFAVESEVAQEIADTLQAKLSPSQANALATAPTRDTEAYDLFLKGEYEEHQAESVLSAEFFDRAQNFYRQALARDPNFALAYARLAYSELHPHWFFSPLTSAELAEIKSNIDRALAIAPESPAVHLALGVFHYWGYRDYDPALREFDRTVELQPNNADAHALRAWIYRRRGEWERSLVAAKRAAELDPRDSSIHGNIGSTYLALRRWSDAEHELSRALVIDPHYVQGYVGLAITYIGSTGDIPRAKRTFEGVLAGNESIGGGAGRVNLGTIASLIGMRAYLDILEKHFADALKVWDAMPTNTAEAHLRRLDAQVAIQVLAGKSAEAQSECEQARALLEARLAKLPQDQESLIASAWVYVGLGRNDDALRVAQQAADSLPIEKDAFGGRAALAGLAEIEARTGRTEEAIRILRQLIAAPAGLVISIARLKIDPVWDPIRSDSGFQQLLAGKELVGPNK